MTRKNIFDVLDANSDLQKEFDDTTKLFYKIKLIGKAYCNYIFGYPHIGIEDAVNRCCFSNWKQRRSCVSLKDFKNRCGVCETDSSTEKGKIQVLEYFANMIFLVEKYAVLHDCILEYEPEYKMLKDNINICLEHLRYSEHLIYEEERILLIPDNVEINTVAESAPPYTRTAILEYNHYLTKGNVEKKKDIICRIYREYESILKQKKSNFGKFIEILGRGINKLSIRHGDKENCDNISLISSASDVEKQYDNIYTIIIFLVFAYQKAIPAKNDLESLFKSMEEANRL